MLLAPYIAAMDFPLSGKLTGVFKYIEQAVEADGSNRASVLERQYQHLSSLIQRQGASLTIEDSTDSLKLLRSGQCPFNAEQSKGLRSLIDSAAAPGADGNGSADAFRKYTKCQEHIFVHNYLNENRWERILADNADIDSIIDVVVDTLGEIGCLWPSPRAQSAMDGCM